MKKGIYFELQHHQVVFWVGVVAGAAIITLIFCYRILMPGEYKSAVLSPRAPIQQTQQLQRVNVLPKSATSATTNVFPTPQGGVSAFPTPQGGYNAFPTPQGG